MTIGNFKLPTGSALIDAASLYYGVQWDITNGNPAMTRIGNINLHASLPIQSQMAGCLVLDNGTVNYWLKPNDWTKKADDSASNLDGTDGQVMVYMPAFYIIFEQSGNTRSVKISQTFISGYTYISHCYISAYEAALQRSTLKLSSLINTSTDYRGGNNTNWDGTYRTLLGRPATNISRTNFRTYARNRGSIWNILPYFVHKLMFWLYMIEYANMNCQLPVNNVLDANGCKQGGLGNGVTTASSADWNTYNSYNPFVACGASNSLANGSGEVSITPPSFPGGISFNVPRYRGIENPFGHIWKWEDGVVINATGGTLQFFYTNVPTNFGDAITNHTNMGNIANVNGYISNLFFGTNGDILPAVSDTIGGSSVLYWCDYFYCSVVTGVYAILVGGPASHGVDAGLGYSATNGAASATATNIGSRLCVLP